MRSVGIDVAKIGFSSIALAVDGEPSRAPVWKPGNKKDTAPMMLEQFFNWLTFQLSLLKPDMVAVEELAVFQNKKTIRALSHHEGIALLAAKRSGAMVVNPPARTVRNIVYGDGSLSKEECWVVFRKKYPDFKSKLQLKQHGGLDQMDAMTHALAAPTVLERR